MSTPQHIVCVFERGTLGVIGRYATEGEAARAMRGAGPTAHVVLDGELSKSHHAMSAHDERRIERALEAGTHPALPLARYAAPAPAPAQLAPEAPAPVEATAAPEEQPEEAAPAEEPTADEAPAEPSLAEVAQLTEVALRTAGTQRVLAKALGVSEATVCRALNRTRRVNAAFVDALRAYVEGPARVEAPAEPAASEEPEETLAPEVEAPRAAPVEAEAKQPAPRVLHVPARAPAGADSAVTLRLEREDAARLYRLLAGSGEQVLRLALADALLGAA